MFWVLIFDVSYAFDHFFSSFFCCCFFKRFVVFYLFIEVPYFLVLKKTGQIWPEDNMRVKVFIPGQAGQSL